jgi:dUTP pyrophosphatase
MNSYVWSFESLQVKRVDERAVLPKRAHPDDAGLDLHLLESIEIPAGGGTKLRTGIALALPQGFVGMVADRSSVAARGLKTAGGIIDAGYRGEIHIVIRNLTAEPIALQAGERIAQLLIIPIATPAVSEVTDFSGSQTTRGTGGFGSTGK